MTVDEALAEADTYGSGISKTLAVEVRRLQSELDAARASVPFAQKVFEAIAASDPDDLVSQVCIDVPKDGYSRQWLRVAVEQYLREVAL